MILKAGEPTRKLTEFIDEASPQLAIYPAGDPKSHPGSAAFPIPQVTAMTLLKLRQDQKEFRGLPSMFAITQGDSVSNLLVWPTPDRDYYAVCSYNPARRDMLDE